MRTKLVVSGSSKNDAWGTNDLRVTRRPKAPYELYWEKSCSVTGVLLNICAGLGKGQSFMGRTWGWILQLNDRYLKNISQLKEWVRGATLSLHPPSIMFASLNLMDIFQSSSYMTSFPAAIVNCAILEAHTFLAITLPSSSLCPQVILYWTFHCCLAEFCLQSSFVLTFHAL